MQDFNGTDLKTLRKSQGVSLDEVAKRAGVAASTVWRIENDLRSARPETARAILRAILGSEAG